MIKIEAICDFCKKKLEYGQDCSFQDIYHGRIVKISYKYGCREACYLCSSKIDMELDKFAVKDKE